LDVGAKDIKNTAIDIMKNGAMAGIYFVRKCLIKNSTAIKDMFYYVVSNATTIVNYSSLAKKLNIDSKTVKEYIGYFEDNFLISTISNYHNKLAQQIKSAKKLYLNDNGFLNLGVNRTENRGSYLENLVFNALYASDDKLTYLKDVYECDFYTQNRLYQVSYNIEDEKTKKRELNGFNSFKFNNDTKSILITYDTNEVIDDVEIISVDKFMLHVE